MPEEGEEVGSTMTVIKPDGTRINLEKLMTEGMPKSEELTEAQKIGRREMREDTTTPRPVYREPK